MKLEINWIKGRKGNEDRLYLITTKEKEPITAFKLSLLANQLAFNEARIKEKWLDLSKEELYFKELVANAIEDGKKGIDWGEPENEQHVLELCENYYLRSERIDFDLLRRTQQKKLAEFNIMSKSKVPKLGRPNQ